MMGMSKSIGTLLVLVLAASGTITLLSVNAESKIIVVPDDYPTIAAAIGNATEGDTVYVKKGTYEEKTLKITKPLSLIGEGADFTKINLDPPRYTSPPDYFNRTHSWFGPSIKVESNDFKLSGFTITTNAPSGAGGGVSITGNRIQIINNNMETGLTVNGSYCNIAENTFSNDIWIFGSYSNFTKNKIAGIVYASGSYLNISANKKTSSNKVGTVDSGIKLEGSFCLVYDNKLIVEGLNPAIGIEGNGNIVVGNSVDRSDVGIRIDGSKNRVYANRITNCLSHSFSENYDSPIGGIGVVVIGSNTFYANYLANNDWAANINQFSKTKTSVFYHNNFVDNAVQVATDDYYDVYGNDSFDNGVEGNYWSDYTGIDADGDGIGDTPYVIDANRQDRFPIMAPFDIDSVTVELTEWMVPLSVFLVSPENATYTADVALNFTVNKQTSWLGYSLDGSDVVVVSGNITLSGLSSGLHNVTVYAEDMFGNSVTSETVYFTIAEPFPFVPVAAASVGLVIVVVVALLVYFKKRKR